MGLAFAAIMCGREGRPKAANTGSPIRAHVGAESPTLGTAREPPLGHAARGRTAYL